MSTIIKNGTIVTADLTHKADVRIENGRITEIGPDLKGDRVLDATGCYVMPGGIDPHTQTPWRPAEYRRTVAAP